MSIAAALGAFLIGYLLGSIPFGLLLTRAAGAGDLRSIGSGNIGATNVLRTGRKGLAAGTLFLDAVKGTLAVVIAVGIWSALVPNPALLDAAARNEMAQLGTYAAGAAAIGAMVGHCFPVWLRFAGGKGVATFLGVMLPLFWPGAISFAVIWLATAYMTKFSSLAALVAVGCSPLLALAMGGPTIAGVLAIMAAIVFYRHTDNIKRLRAGTESRIGGTA